MTGQADCGLSCYIHIPFCVRKCPYCDFYSVPGQPVSETDYLTRLKAELHHRRDGLSHDSRPLRSIFLGGGTPSLLQTGSIQTILEAVRQCWPLEPDCEITLEANPESCLSDKITGWRAAGVNRISLGVQALSDARLKRLGRPHDRAMALAALKRLRQAEFPRINVDLIHGTPGHTLSEWQEELAEACQWKIGHLSCYALTVEPDTPFHRLAQQGQLSLPDDDHALALFQFTRRFLSDHGYLSYEISNFAFPGQECRHNLNYWEFGDYLGLGAGAHGKWTDGSGQTWRTANPADLTAYHTGSVAPPIPVDSEEAGLECLMMGMRLQKGMSRARYRQLTGNDPVAHYGEKMDTLLQHDLVEVDAEYIRLTSTGTPLLDAILLHWANY
ncbi:MAG: radical SAM family heme chaperone HemW [Magnetococcales bacterium]|nr:radical SAM family heme chaperone HemW [Magnetococcales bacterium]